MKGFASMKRAVPARISSNVMVAQDSLVRIVEVVAQFFLVSGPRDESGKSVGRASARLDNDTDPLTVLQRNLARQPQDPVFVSGFEFQTHTTASTVIDVDRPILADRPA